MATSEPGVNTWKDKRRKKRLFEKHEYKCNNTDFFFRLINPWTGVVTAAESPVFCHHHCRWMLGASGCWTGLKAGVNELVLMGTLMARGWVR